MHNDSIVPRNIKITLSLIVIVSVILGAMLFAIGTLVWAAITQPWNNPLPPQPIQWEPALLQDCPEDSALRAAGCPCWIKDRGSIRERFICDSLPVSTPLNP